VYILCVHTKNTQAQENNTGLWHSMSLENLVTNFSTRFDFYRYYICIICLRS